MVVLSTFPLIEVGDAQSSTKTPIKHLVVLMMENHSFDNLFGVYGTLSNGSHSSAVTVPLDLTNYPVTEGLSPVQTGKFNTPNPYEGYSNYHVDWNNGSMNGFLNGSGASSLSYFTVSQAGLEWMLAKQYALADTYFSSTLSETLPNRLYSLAGFSPVREDQSTPPPYVLYNQTIFGEMDHYGVTWGYYFQDPSKGTDPLQFIAGPLQSSNIGSWETFGNELANGTLPDVSWVSPISGGASDCSQHPPNNILAGEIWIFSIINQIMSSPYWNSTAVMVTYDEGGGYYDQVAPPILHGVQLGFRVPFILVSPFAKEDYISNTILTHTSILSFIDYNWNMPALNSLVLYSNIPLDMFDFNRAYLDGNLMRMPLNFNSTELSYLPSSLDSSFSLAQTFSNVSDAFQMNFQIPTSQLPYSTFGNSAFNLSQVSSSVYVQSDTAYVPSYLYYELLAFALSILLLSVLYLAVNKRRKRR